MVSGYRVVAAVCGGGVRRRRTWRGDGCTEAAEALALPLVVTRHAMTCLSLLEKLAAAAEALAVLLVALGWVGDTGLDRAPCGRIHLIDRTRKVRRPGP